MKCDVENTVRLYCNMYLTGSSGNGYVSAGKKLKPILIVKDLLREMCILSQK